MFLATNPEIPSNKTLDAFVKLYSDSKERDRDIAITNFLAGIGLYPIGSAKAVELQSLRLEREEGSEIVYTCATKVRDSTGSSASHAIVTRFARVQTLLDFVGEASSDIVELLKGANDSIIQLHRKGYEERAKCTAGINPISYEQLCEDRITERGTALYTTYKQLGIGSLLDSYETKQPAFVNGDLHPQNILIDTEGNIFATDFEMAHIGVAQEDLTMMLGNRQLQQNSGLSLEQELAIVGDYALKSDSEESEFRRFYHLATIHRELQICRYIVARPEVYSGERFDSVYSFHLGRALTHARFVFSYAEVNELEASANQTFLNHQ
jgi:thiamine kinase-like enzyme